MSNEFKLVPVELLERIVKVSNSFADHRQAQHDLVKFLAADPQPPALGGEPKRIPDDDESVSPEWADGHNTACDAWQHYLAPLQAEIDRLKEESFEKLYDAAIDERDQLKALCDELEAERVKAYDFLLHIKKCLRRNGEYSPLSHQELDELIGHNPSNDCQCRWCALSKPAEGGQVCHLCRGEGRVGGPAPDEGGGKNCALCEGSGMEMQA